MDAIPLLRDLALVAGPEGMAVANAMAGPAHPTKTAAAAIVDSDILIFLGDTIVFERLFCFGQIPNLCSLRLEYKMSNYSTLYLLNAPLACG